MQLETTEAVEIIDITDKVAREVPADLDAGLCTIFVHHTTTGVVNNEAESGLLTDIESWLADIVDDIGRHRPVSVNGRLTQYRRTEPPVARADMGL